MISSLCGWDCRSAINKVYRNTVFPEPVLPPTRRWGIDARSKTISLPSGVFPRAKYNCSRESPVGIESSTSLYKTLSRWSRGISKFSSPEFIIVLISIPVRCISRPISSRRLVILLRLCPCSSLKRSRTNPGPTTAFSGEHSATRTWNEEHARLKDLTSCLISSSASKYLTLGCTRSSSIAGVSDGVELSALSSFTCSVVTADVSGSDDDTEGSVSSSSVEYCSCAFAVKSARESPNISFWMSFGNSDAK